MSTANDNVIDYSRTSPVAYVRDVPITGGEQPYVAPRQTGTGTTRGTQTIAGRLNVTDPSTGKTIIVIGYSPGAF